MNSPFFVKFHFDVHVPRKSEADIRGGCAGSQHKLVSVHPNWNIVDDVFT